MFHAHESHVLAGAPRGSAPRDRARRRRGGVELAAATSLAWCAALILFDDGYEAWPAHTHAWLVPLLVATAYAGARVRALLGRSRGERTVVLDATGSALIGAALLLPPLWFPVVAIASAWCRGRAQVVLNTAVRVMAMSSAMLAYQAMADVAAARGLPSDAVRVSGLVAAGAAYLAAEGIAHLRHLDLGDGLGEEISGLGPRLLLQDSPGVALGLVVVALLAVSPVTLVLVVPLAVLVVRSIRAQDALLRAGTDHKTGLLTLHSFRPVALSEISRARRHGRPLVAVMMDLDRMKSVNNDHGHLVGEQVLAAVGDLLGSSMRAEDVVARFGGDEFCLLLPDTAVDGGLAIVERLRARVASSVLAGGDRPVRRTASFGLARLQVDDDVDALLERADSALRRAKAEGRDRVIVLD